MKIRTAAMADLDALATVEAQCFPAAEAAEAGKPIKKTSPCVSRTCFLFPFPCYAKLLS